MCRGVRYHSNSLNSGKEHAQKARAESLGPVPLGCLSREPSPERSDRPQQTGALAPEDTARRDEQLSSQPGTLARTGTPRRPGRHPSDPVSVLSSPHTPKPQTCLPFWPYCPGPSAFNVTTSGACGIPPTFSATRWRPGWPTQCPAHLAAWGAEMLSRGPTRPGRAAGPETAARSL